MYWNSVLQVPLVTNTGKPLYKNVDEQYELTDYGQGSDTSRKRNCTPTNECTSFAFVAKIIM